MPNQRLSATRTHGLSSTSVWTEFTPLALKHNAVNLGQGFPDFAPERFVLDAMKDAVDRSLVQYARSQGHLRLVNALAATFSPLLGRSLDLNNVIATVGATEALYLSFMAFCNPGDEVLLFEPFYDSYPACVELAGGKSVFVPLRPQSPNQFASDWKLDINEVRAAITPKTKMLVLNNPSNIPGKVWTRHELESLCALAVEKNLIVVSDEVYEWIVYDEAMANGGEGHIRTATLPGMWERTITIGSAGKAFSVTGFKVGWLIADSPLVEVLQRVHTHACFSVNTPAQEAIAMSLEQAAERNYFSNLRKMFAEKRDKLLDVLKNAGLRPVVPQGSYFILADTSNVDDAKFLDKDLLASGKPGTTRDYQFCRWLTKEVGVAAIPPSAFYSKDHAHMAANYARFAFCKKQESFDGARERLKKLL